MSENGTDSAQTYLSELGNLARTVDQDDLPGLAKMHELFESLASSGSTGLSEEGQKIANEMVRTLEAVILGQISDATDAIASVQSAVSGLGSQVVQGSGGAAEESDARTVNEQLDRVFDEPVSSPEATAETETSSPIDEVEAIGDAENTPFDQESMTSQPDNIEMSEDEPWQDEYVAEPLVISKDEIDMVVGFIEEATEHLDAIEAAVLEVERSPSDAEAIDSLFRPFHTIKGAAGFLNLRDIVSLTHEAETLLDQARRNERQVTHGLIDLVFEVVDILKVQFEGIRNHLADPIGEIVPQPPIGSMIANLRNVVAGRFEPMGSSSSAGDPNMQSGENPVERDSIPQQPVDVSEQAPNANQSGQEPVMQNEAKSNAAKSSGDQSVRIDTAKLDALVDMVGELVIAQTQVSASPLVANDPRLAKDVTRSTKIVRDVQDAAMAMRMIPIGPTFQKMARLVRDVARKVGKNVELAISGEDTELDKNVIQQIGDPLVHMVRNAVDHGIEPADVRIAAGKPASGNVELSAYHSGGNIVIEITDDGKGLNAEALIRKAVEKGIIGEDDQLSEEQAYDLIFAPGFSTAETVTGVSGRGVGMDVVRRNIENLRGKCEINSTPGKGSTFSIRLPLTLAIIDGMVLRVGTERFIIQTVTVENALRPTSEQISSVQHKGSVLNARGRLIPLVHLGPLFGSSETIDPCDAIVVIAQYEGGEVGIVVDELIGQQQVVIKPLGERFQKLRGISGAAILGDGKVGLILDVPGIVAAQQLPKPVVESAKIDQPVPVVAE